MILKTYKKIIVFEDEIGNEIIIKKDITRLKIVTKYGEEYNGLVIGLFDDRLILDNIRHDILFVSIKEVFLL